ncbi:MAG: glycogen-binding domain-containing protein [Thermodesulfobacteriota bacterium]
MDDIISKFIDNEMDLEEKIVFVERIHGDRTFRDESLELLQQEKLLRSEMVERIPAVILPVRKKFFTPFLRPAAVFASGMAALLIILFFSFPSRVATPTTHRFVLYLPQVRQVEITGSFTDWKRIPLKPTGSSGYWEVTLTIPEGEHRFTYILEGHQRISDPTVPTREKDDFGGENSLLYVGA